MVAGEAYVVVLGNDDGLVEDVVGVTDPVHHRVSLRFEWNITIKKKTFGIKVGFQFTLCNV